MTRFATLLFVLVLFLIVPAAHAQTVVYVDQSAGGAGDGSSWQDAYPFLQDALDEVSVNAGTDYEIRVAEGTYYPDEDADGDRTPGDRDESFTLARDGVQLQGGYPSGGGTPDPEAHPTILSGDIDGSGTLTGNSYRVSVLDGTTGNGPVTSATVIDGFTITGGNANAGGSTFVNNTGGGIYCNGDGTGGVSGAACSPVLRNLVFTGNRANFHGGAIENDGDEGEASPTFVNVTFTGNRANFGGAVYNEGTTDGEASPTFTRATFTGNEAEFGGAVYNNAFQGGDASPVFTGAAFTGNTAAGAGNSASDGGAIANDAADGTASPVLTRVTFTGNSAADKGGAIYNNSLNGTASSMLTNAAFAGNSASSGGALYNEGSFGGVASPVLINVTFAGNSASSSGGAVYNLALDASSTATPMLTNTILSGNTAAGSGAQVFNDGGAPIIKYSLVEGGCASISGATCGGGNLDADPQFADTTTADGDSLTLRLQGPGSSGGPSPAIDAGDNTAVPDTLTDDLAGLDRFQDVPEVSDTGNGTAPIVDLGAYESDGSPLPVELASFTARADGQQSAVLQWRTLTETGNDGFRIERRNGGEEEWKKGSFVESRAEGGTSQEPLSYSFRVEDLGYGAHQFRLVQRDIGGHLAPVGEGRSVEIGLSGAYDLSKAYPNPLRERATLTLAVRQAQEVTVSVYDALGRRVRVLHAGPLEAQKTKRFTLQADDLASGVYFVRVVGKDFSATRRAVVID